MVAGQGGDVSGVVVVVVDEAQLLLVRQLRQGLADALYEGVVEFQRLFEKSEAGKVIKAEITAQGKKMEAELKEKGIRLIDEKPRKGAGGARIAFLHPKSTCGVLVELCQRDN